MNSKTRAESKLKIVVALAVAAALFFTPTVGVDAAKTKKATSKKTDARKKASVYDVKTNSVKINLDGYKDSEDKIEECNGLIMDESYNEAISLMNSGKIVDA